MNFSPKIEAQSSAIEVLADAISATSFTDLPAEVVTEAKWRILDYFGGVLWGVHVGTAGAMRSVVEEFGGKAEAQLLGRPVRLPAVWAAYLNSCAAPALLDTCRFTASHPGIVTVPAAVAAGEISDASGRDLIVGVVWGYEALIRLGRAIPFDERGFDATSIAGAFGAAAAAAKTMRQTRAQTVNTLALSATMSNGLTEAYAAIDSSRNQFGRAAQGGIFAALLSKQGVVGNSSILEGGKLEGCRGLLAALSDKADPSALVADIGRKWGVLQIGAKIHDGCRYTNTAADAVFSLVREHGFGAKDIKAIRVGTFRRALAVSVRRPTTVSGALFCIEYVVATALLADDVFNDKFTLERLNDPIVKGLMTKVDVGLNEEIDRAYPGKFGLKMEVDLIDGRRLECEMPFPRGEPENPLSADEYETKFMKLATPLLTARRAARVLTLIRNIEALNDLNELVALCQPE